MRDWCVILDASSFRDAKRIARALGDQRLDPEVESRWAAWSNPQAPAEKAAVRSVLRGERGRGQVACRPDPADACAGVALGAVAIGAASAGVERATSRIRGS